jgi:hypothetical protein
MQSVNGLENTRYYKGLKMIGRHRLGRILRDTVAEIESIQKHINEIGNSGEETVGRKEFDSLLGSVSNGLNCLSLLTQEITEGLITIDKILEGE